MKYNHHEELAKMENQISEMIWHLNQQMTKSDQQLDVVIDLLEKAEANVEAHKDLVNAARRMLRHIDAEAKTTRTSGGGYALAADNLRLSLAFITNPNGDTK